MKKMSIKSSQKELKVELERSPTIPMNCPPDVVALGHSDSDPKTFNEALRGPNAKEWQSVGLQDQSASKAWNLGCGGLTSLSNGNTMQQSCESEERTGQDAKFKATECGL